MKNRFKKTITSMLEIPKEVVLNLPLISMIGNEELTIENYKGIIEYSEDRIRINTSFGIILICGRKLFLQQITSESIIITGAILKFEFII